MLITENIHSIKCYIVQKFKEHKVMMDSRVYLVRGKKTALVDCSHHVAAEGLLERMKYLSDYDAKDLSYILLTHAHGDHSGGTSVFKQYSPNALVACHESGKESVEVYGETNVDLLLRDGDEIDLGDNQTLRVIHSPGHSVDSICFLTTKEKALITGDSIGPGPGLEDAFDRVKLDNDPSFGGPYIERIPWIGVLNNADAYIDTLYNLRKIDFEMILPGHGTALFGKMARRYLDFCIEHFHIVDKIIAETSGNDYRIIAKEVCKKFQGFGIKGLPEEPWNLCVFTLETINAFLRRQDRL